MVIILPTSTSHEKLFVPLRRSRSFEPSDTQRSSFLELGPMFFASAAQIVVVLYLTSTLCLANVKGQRGFVRPREGFGVFLKGWTSHDAPLESWVLTIIKARGWFGSKQCPGLTLPFKAKTMFVLTCLFSLIATILPQICSSHFQFKTTSTMTKNET